MTATTRSRDTDKLSLKPYIDQVSVLVGAGKNIRNGAIVAIDATTGLLEEAVGTNANHIAVGVALNNVDNTAGGAGAVECLVGLGVFKFYHVGLTQPKVFQRVSVLDNQTFTTTAAANARNSGVLIRLAKASPTPMDDLQANECWVKIDGSIIIS